MAHNGYKVLDSDLHVFEPADPARLHGAGLVAL